MLRVLHVLSALRGYGADMAGFTADPASLEDGAAAIRRALQPTTDIALEPKGSGLDAFGNSAAADACSALCATWQAAQLLLGDNATTAAGLLLANAAKYELTDRNLATAMDPQGRLAL
jgi:hypothetical protein